MDADLIGVNPARCFGVYVASHFPGYHWIHWVSIFLFMFDQWNADSPGWSLGCCYCPWGGVLYRSSVDGSAQRAIAFFYLGDEP